MRWKLTIPARAGLNNANFDSCPAIAARRRVSDAQNPVFMTPYRRWAHRLVRHRYFHAVCGRTAPIKFRSLCRAIYRFDSANSVSRCEVFFCSPRKRTFASPNCRLITRNGCSTLARSLGFPVLFLLDPGLGSAGRHLPNVAGPRGDVPLQIIALHSLARTPVAGVGIRVLFLAKPSYKTGSSQNTMPTSAMKAPLRTSP